MINALRHFHKSSTYLDSEDMLSADTAEAVEEYSVVVAVVAVVPAVEQLDLVQGEERFRAVLGLLATGSD